MARQFTTCVDFFFNAVHNKEVKEIKKHLKGAKDEQNLVTKLADSNEKCANAVHRLSKVIQLAEEEKFDEAKNEEISASGAYKRNLRPFVLDQIKNSSKANPAIQQDTQHEKQQNGELQKSKDARKISEEQDRQGKKVENRNNTATNQAEPPSQESLKANNRDGRTKHVGENRIKTEVSDEIRGKQASQAIQRNNPDIADLSDVNRPTKLAERFSELYDNEWTEAFEFLHNKKNVEETKSIEYLLCIVNEAYKFCRKKAENQIKDLATAFLGIIEQGKECQKKGNAGSELSEENRCILVQLRKEIAAKGIPKLQEDFLETVKTKCVQNRPAKAPILDHFCERAVDLTWWMCVQDPPVYMCPMDDKTKADKNLYRAYTKSGDRIEYYVWPALRLYKDGGVLSKGVVQYK